MRLETAPTGNAGRDLEIAPTKDAISDSAQYINTPPDDLPVGFRFRNLAHDKHYLRGFAFDKALEHLTTHPFFSSKIPAEAGGEVAL